MPHDYAHDHLPDGQAAGEHVQINAFGVLQTEVDGRAVVIGPPKQRELLALLLCRPHVEVPAEELVEGLWAGRPPASAPSNLRYYVHRLRRELGETVIVGSGRPGYRLRTERLSSDIAEFSALCARADEALDRRDVVAARSALCAATALRRDRAFADVTHLPAVADEVVRLEERWLLAVEQRIEIDLELGRTAELVGELTGLVARHPYRERFVYLLMVALYRSGRQTEALAAYRQVSELLAEEFAVEPRPELTELHLAILRQDPGVGGVIEARPRPRDVAPAELPCGSGVFLGRDRETAALNEAVAEARRLDMLPLVAIVGPAGIGKTALAVRWARQRQGDFPDGQIFVDLRGFSPEPRVQPAEAQRRLLWSLGVEADRVPQEPDEAMALCRSLLADKRMLIVLDNVVSAAQVAALLPGGPGNAVIVTSRNRLPALAAHQGARHLVLEPLPAEAAYELVGRIIGASGTSAEPAATRELAARCGHLPLALCIAAANLADDPTRTITAQLARQHAGGWFGSLGIPGDPDDTVKSAFDLSLRALTEAQQRLFDLIGLIPGPNFAAGAAAALTGGSTTTTEHDLVRLVHAHLVQRAPDGRFALHDLIREYARDRSRALPAGEQAAATFRLYEYYRDAADIADRVLQPGALRLPVRADCGRVTHPAVTDERSARAWFAGEAGNLVAACLHAAERGVPEMATRLADVLGGYLWTERDLTTWSTVAQAAAGAARRVGDLAAEAAMEIALAKIANCRCDYPEAVARLRAAIDLAQRGGWRQAQAVALGSLAALQDELGETRAAARQLRTALVFSRQTGDRLQEGRTLVHLGIYHSEQGRLATADRLFAMALDRIDAEGSRIGRAIVLNNLAELCLLRRRFGEAYEYAGEVLGLCADLGHVSSTIVACNVMSAACRSQGDAGAAREFATRSLAIATTLGDAYSLGIAHHEVAGVHDAAGDHVGAITHHREAHRFTAGIQSRFLDVEHSIALALAKHRLAVRAGDRVIPDPHEMHRALRRARGNGYRGLEGAALAALAETHHDCGDRDGAKRYARQSLSIQSGAGWRTDAALLTMLVRYGRRTSRVYRNYAAHY